MRFIFNCIVVPHGLGLLGEHCVLENRAGIVTLIPQDGVLCSVNGSVVTGPRQLTQGKHICKDNMLLGEDFSLRFTIILLDGSNNTSIHFDCI